MSLFRAYSSRSITFRQMQSVLCAALVLAPQSPLMMSVARGQCCGDTVNTVLNYQAIFWIHTQCLGRIQENIRCGLGLPHMVS